MQRELLGALSCRALALRTAAELDRLVDRVGSSRYVLLGEASHGTHEFYLWRAALTRKLVEERGFSFVAVEGDWPDFERVDDYVKCEKGNAENARSVLRGFHRWPTWMWANTDVSAFMEWLRDHNEHLPAERRVGMHGLDVYSLWDSMDAVIRYLDRNDPTAARRVRHEYECFAPYDQDAAGYARATALLSTSCEDEVVRALGELRAQRAGDDRASRTRYFSAEQSALIAKNAEAYYRTMIRSGRESWNVRDEHMMDTLDRLSELYGPGSKAIVWAHNTHVGDARYTDMAPAGQINLGQLVRERHSKDGVALIGFATSGGTVMAGDRWGLPARIMELPDARRGSIEDVLDHIGHARALYLFDGEEASFPLLVPRGHRAVGVVYDPQVERYANYVPTVLPRTYDALIYIQRTRALHAIDAVARAERDAPETFPSAL